MTGSEYQQLVEFLGRHFTEIDHRFAQIDQRFAQVDQRFAQIDQRFAQIDRRFDGIDQRIDELRREMLGHFDEIYRRLERFEQEYQAVLQALRRIEAAIADDRVRRELAERAIEELKRQVTALQTRIETLERELRR
jgi:chromosome segregation ATPase